MKGTFAIQIYIFINYLVDKEHKISRHDPSDKASNRRFSNINRTEEVHTIIDEGKN